MAFHENFKTKTNNFVHLTYKAAKSFPKEKLYGITSQLRRASLSVILNYIEGYARVKSKVHKNFLEIAYGSLQESKYLLEFSFQEGFLKKQEFDKLIILAEEIGAMLWGILKNMP